MLKLQLAPIFAPENYASLTLKMERLRNFLSNYWQQHPLRSVLLLGLLLRLLAAVFSQGYAFNDDHFSIISPIQAWMDGLPMWGDPDLPPTHSLVYVGSQYFLFKVFHLVGLTDPHGKMLGIRIFHAFYSLLTIYFGYKLTKELSDKKHARFIGLIFALFWIFPFVSVRNLVEVVCIPFVLAGFIWLIRASKAPDFNWKIWVVAGLLFGCAFAIRYHTILIVGGSGLVLLYRKQWKGAVLFSLAYLLIASLTTGLIDWTMYRYPFHSIVHYYQYNVAVAYDMITGPADRYLVVLVFLLGPPVSLCFLFGFARGFKIEPLIFYGCLIFFLWHSSFPHKQERFIFPIIPLIIILGYLGWQHLVENSSFWEKRRRWLSIGWGYFWGLNTIFLIALTFSSVHLARANSMYFFKDKDDIKSIIVHHPKLFWRFNPIYYSGKIIARWESLKIDRDYLWHNAIQSKEYLEEDFVILFTINSSDSIPSLIKTLSEVNKKPNYILIKGREEHESRLRQWEKQYASMEFLAEIKPSNFDRIMHLINPTFNPDDHFYIYKADVE